MNQIAIAKEFSETPGPRYKREGKYSGEEFLDAHLAPAFERALKEGAQLLIDLDGAEGYPTSFLEEAFGGLARRYSPEQVLKVLKFRSTEEPYLINEITRYIREAKATT